MFGGHKLGVPIHPQAERLKGGTPLQQVLRIGHKRVELRAIHGLNQCLAGWKVAIQCADTHAGQLSDLLQRNRAVSPGKLLAGHF